jgi:hypothetical protein
MFSLSLLVISFKRWTGAGPKWQKAILKTSVIKSRRWSSQFIQFSKVTLPSLEFFGLPTNCVWTAPSIKSDIVLPLSVTRRDKIREGVGRVLREILGVLAGC